MTVLLVSQDIATCSVIRTSFCPRCLRGSNRTAGINRSNTAVQAVLEQPCLTGRRTGTVRPKHLPAGRTGLSDQFLGPVTQDQPGPVGQICPTSWLSLRSCLSDHRSNTAVQAPLELPCSTGQCRQCRYRLPELLSLSSSPDPVLPAEHAFPAPEIPSKNNFSTPPTHPGVSVRTPLFRRGRLT
ncbi:hypothetical protein PCANC_13711 [Puccinia coronata f. sp. avenae]|uniref:Uncharacterized protein n=1 Tax=Puccinia coronata f. sp. avenae TaxID=200324 RepID=A0A2N5VFN5_9BASI|nr:hypothetical protein PCANC_13711 [Puccinia coronata f. sp. avenae]